MPRRSYSKSGTQREPQAAKKPRSDYRAAAGCKRRKMLLTHQGYDGKASRAFSHLCGFAKLEYQQIRDDARIKKKGEECGGGC